MRAPTGLTAAGLVLGIVVADRATKLWAVHWLQPRSPIELLPVLHLTYLENTGAAFGILRDSNALLMAVSAALLGALLWLRRRWPRQDALTQLALLLVAGGALGNLYDRLAYGYVVDFVDLRVWPVFNVADSCITIGACGLAWGLSAARAERVRS